MRLLFFFFLRLTGGKFFTRSLIVHFSGCKRNYAEMVIKTVDGRYRCAQCHKATYKHKYHLYAHLREECGVVPGYQCPFCDYQGKQKSHLKTHVIAIHKTTV